MMGDSWNEKCVSIYQKFHIWYIGSNIILFREEKEWKWKRRLIFIAIIYTLINFTTAIKQRLLTGSHISLCHVTGRCFLLAAGNTPINCSNGRNWTKKFGIFKNKVTCIFFPYQIINHKNYQYMHMWAIKNFACIN